MQFNSCSAFQASQGCGSEVDRRAIEGRLLLVGGSGQSLWLPIVALGEVASSHTF